MKLLLLAIATFQGLTNSKEWNFNPFGIDVFTREKASPVISGGTFRNFRNASEDLQLLQRISGVLELLQIDYTQQIVDTIDSVKASLQATRNGLFSLAGKTVLTCEQMMKLLKIGSGVDGNYLSNQFHFLRNLIDEISEIVPKARNDYNKAQTLLEEIILEIAWFDGRLREQLTKGEMILRKMHANLEGGLYGPKPSVDSTQQLNLIGMMMNVLTSYGGRLVPSDVNFKPHTLKDAELAVLQADEILVRVRQIVAKGLSDLEQFRTKITRGLISMKDLLDEHISSWIKDFSAIRGFISSNTDEQIVEVKAYNIVLRGNLALTQSFLCIPCFLLIRCLMGTFPA